MEVDINWCPNCDKMITNEKLFCSKDCELSDKEGKQNQTRFTISKRDINNNNSTNINIDDNLQNLNSFQRNRMRSNSYDKSSFFIGSPPQPHPLSIHLPKSLPNNEQSYLNKFSNSLSMSTIPSTSQLNQLNQSDQNKSASDQNHTQPSTSTPIKTTWSWDKFNNDIPTYKSYSHQSKSYDNNNKLQEAYNFSAQQPKLFFFNS